MLLLTEIENLIYIENKMQRLRESVYNPSFASQTKLLDLVATPVMLSKAEEYEVQCYFWTYVGLFSSFSYRGLKIRFFTFLQKNAKKLNPRTNACLEIV